MLSLVRSCCYDSDKARKFLHRRHGDVLENVHNCAKDGDEIGWERCPGRTQI